MEASPARVIQYFNGEKQNLIPLFQRLVVQKTPKQPTDQEFRPFLRILHHERSAFERSCPTSSDLKPMVFVEEIRKSYILKSCWVSDTRVLCTTKVSASVYLGREQLAGILG